MHKSVAKSSRIFVEPISKANRIPSQLFCWSTSQTPLDFIRSPFESSPTPFIFIPLCLIKNGKPPFYSRGPNLSSSIHSFLFLQPSQLPALAHPTHQARPAFSPSPSGLLTPPAQPGRPASLRLPPLPCLASAQVATPRAAPALSSTLVSRGAHPSTQPPPLALKGRAAPNLDVSAPPAPACGCSTRGQGYGCRGHPPFAMGTLGHHTIKTEPPPPAPSTQRRRPSSPSLPRPVPSTTTKPPALGREPPYSALIPPRRAGAQPRNAVSAAPLPTDAPATPTSSSSAKRRGCDTNLAPTTRVAPSPRA